MSLELKISSFKACVDPENPKTTYTTFLCEIDTGTHRWTIAKRYSEFHKFFKGIQEDCSDVRFPPKQLPSVNLSTLTTMPMAQKHLEKRRAALDTFMKSVAIVKRPPSVFRALYDFIDANQSLKASRGFWEAVRGEEEKLSIKSNQLQKVVAQTGSKNEEAPKETAQEEPPSYWARNENLLLPVPVLLLLMATWCSAQFAFTLCCFLLGAATVYMQRQWSQAKPLSTPQDPEPEETPAPAGDAVEVMPDEEGETERMALMAKFQKAARELGDWKPTRSTPTVQEQLVCYGLYKQATKGDVQGSRPGMMDVKVSELILLYVGVIFVKSPCCQMQGRAKWDAWATCKGAATTTAMRDYVAAASRQMEKYGGA
jgi:acyl-CoA-binding protein